MEFQTSPQTAIEALIHINNQLRQPEAAVGVLTYAQKHLHMELKESWWVLVARRSVGVEFARVGVSGTGHHGNVPDTKIWARKVVSTSARARDRYSGVS